MPPRAHPADEPRSAPSRADTAGSTTDRRLASSRASTLARGLTRMFGAKSAPEALAPMHGWPARTVLIQNYHPTACRALVRDFQKIGFRVYSPDSDWGCISYYASNSDLGSELISREDYMSLPAGFVLITCRLHEQDLRAIAYRHRDQMVLNVAEHDNTYQAGLGNILLCPDIKNYEEYPNFIKHKLLYFMRPHISEMEDKNIGQSFDNKEVCCYISRPQFWPEGSAAYAAFKALYPHDCRFYGLDSPDGTLTHAQVNRSMTRSYFTVHFKEQEAYGLSCLESMMLGTPVVSLKRFMADKTLGRFFLSPETAVVTDTVEEAVERLGSMTLEAYGAMSTAARARVMELTSDARTVDRLDAAISEYAPR